MKLVVILLVFYSTFLPQPIQASDVDEEYTLPLFPNSQRYEEHDEIELDLGRDSYSGCVCKYTSKKWIVCFGTENCLRIPKSIQIIDKSLKIRTSSIERISINELKNYRHLTHLEIEANLKLEVLEPGCFKHLENLRNLSISHNPNLKTIEEKTFEGLVNLRELFLIKNGLNNIHKLAFALSPNYLPKLVTLLLNENLFFQIRKDDLIPMTDSPVEELSLVLCGIDQMDPESLLPLKNLKILRLGENTFNSSVITELLKTMVKHKISLTKLNLYGIGFRKDPPRELLSAIAESNISTLSLARNQFETLNNNSFIRMNNLKMLDLREALIMDITADAFNGMPNLETLLLNRNKISFLPDGALLPQLKYLDLSSNSGTAPQTSYFSLAKNKFMNMTKLWGLNLSNNNIRVLLNSTFVGLSSLEVLSLRNASIYQIKYGAFLYLKKLKYMDLENNPLNENNLPLTRDTFSGLEKLEVLLLGGCSLSVFSYENETNPFAALTSLRHLGLERNNIAILSPNLFLPLRKLTEINISQNFITSWKERLFINNSLIHLQASHNKFTSITEAMLKDFSHLKDLDLSNNPFTCDCKLVYVIYSNKGNVYNVSLKELLSEDPPYCTAPTEYSNISVLTFYETFAENNACEVSITNTVIKYSLTLIFLATLSLISFVISYKYRWHIRYWVFLTKIAIIRKGRILQRNRNPLGKQYQFDAFVSYSNEDRNFVIHMISMLENYEPYLKLCVYERDFKIGDVISESVLESVAKSRKTLLVVSNSYIKSHWCRWEAQVAENYRLFFQNENGDLVNDSIVVIKLGQVDKSNMTPMLKYLLKTRIYLQWDSEKAKQKEFWKKLRNYLTPPCKFDSDSCYEN